ncbi:unnamed protein product, partial [Staurois parvus]
MHSPKKKQTTSLAVHTKLSMCRVSSDDISYQEIRGGHWKMRRIREERITQPFYRMQRNNPLGSTVSITSMLYCQGRTDNSWGPRAIGDHGTPVSLPKLKKAY